MHQDTEQRAEDATTLLPPPDDATPNRGSALWTGYGDDFAYGDAGDFDGESDSAKEGTEDGDDDACSAGSAKNRWADVYRDQPGHGVWHEASAKGCKIYWTITHREGNPLGWHCSAYSRGAETSASASTLDAARKAAIGALLRGIDEERDRIPARRMAKASRSLEKKMAEAVQSQSVVVRVSAGRDAAPKSEEAGESGRRGEEGEAAPDQEDFIVIY